MVYPIYSFYRYYLNTSSIGPALSWVLPQNCKDIGILSLVGETFTWKQIQYNMTSV